MTFVTIMIVALTSGEEFALGFNSQRDCGDALLKLPEVAAELHTEVDSAICIPTIAPGKSPRPKPKPEMI